MSSLSQVANVSADLAVCCSILGCSNTSKYGAKYWVKGGLKIPARMSSALLKPGTNRNTGLVCVKCSKRYKAQTVADRRMQSKSDDLIYDESGLAASLIDMSDTKSNAALSVLIAAALPRPISSAADAAAAVNTSSDTQNFDQTQQSDKENVNPLRATSDSAFRRRRMSNTSPAATGTETDTDSTDSMIVARRRNKRKSAVRSPAKQKLVSVRLAHVRRKRGTELKHVANQSQLFNCGGQSLLQLAGLNGSACPFISKQSKERAGKCVGKLLVAGDRSRGGTIAINFQCDVCKECVLWTNASIDASQQSSDAHSALAKHDPSLVHSVMTSIAKGTTYRSIELERAFGGSQHQMGKRVYYTILHSLKPVIKSVANKHFESVAAELKDPIDLAWDCSWAHRGGGKNGGGTSLTGTFMVLDAHNRRIVFAYPMYKPVFETDEGGKTKYKTDGNYWGGSGGMEYHGAKTFVDWFRQQPGNKLKQWRSCVADRDTELQKVLQQHADTRHVVVAFDPGHLKKNLRTALIKFVGQGKKIVSFPERISRFFMIVLKRSVSDCADADKRYELFMNRMESLQHHLTRPTCYNSAPPCACQLASIEDEVEEAGLYVPPNECDQSSSWPDSSTSAAAITSGNTSAAEYDEDERTVLESWHAEKLANKPDVLNEYYQRNNKSAAAPLQPLCIQPPNNNMNSSAAAAAATSESQPLTSRTRIVRRTGSADPLELDTRFQRERIAMTHAHPYLDTSNDQERACLIELLRITAIYAKLARNCMDGLHTCVVESTNAQRCAFISKRLNITASYEARSLMAALVWNVNFSGVFELLYTAIGRTLPQPVRSSLQAFDAQRTRLLTAKRAMDKRKEKALNRRARDKIDALHENQLLRAGEVYGHASKQPGSVSIGTSEQRIGLRQIEVTTTAEQITGLQHAKSKQLAARQSSKDEKHGSLWTAALQATDTASDQTSGWRERKQMELAARAAPVQDANTSQHKTIDAHITSSVVQSESVRIPTPAIPILPPLTLENLPLIAPPPLTVDWIDRLSQQLPAAAVAQQCTTSNVRSMR